jgi:transcriptional regulator of NAD metabolism
MIRNQNSMTVLREQTNMLLQLDVVHQLKSNFITHKIYGYPADQKIHLRGRPQVAGPDFDLL